MSLFWYAGGAPSSVVWFAAFVLVMIHLAEQYFLHALLRKQRVRICGRTIQQMYGNRVWRERPVDGLVLAEVGYSVAPVRLEFDDGASIRLWAARPPERRRLVTDLQSLSNRPFKIVQGVFQRWRAPIPSRPEGFNR
jgi:hypothetical protein